MTKAELVRQIQIAFVPDMPRKEISKLVDLIFEEIAMSVRREGKFSYPDFGTFVLRRRKSRTGKDPRTKEAITMPASVTVGFRPSPEFKKSLERLNR
jgi:nucleoid DNA-binding protein